jgi:hypothetical protein
MNTATGGSTGYCAVEPAFGQPKPRLLGKILSKASDMLAPLSAWRRLIQIENENKRDRDLRAEANGRGVTEKHTRTPAHHAWRPGHNQALCWAICVHPLRLSDLI